jgi:uncharacterized membrane protein
VGGICRQAEQTQLLNASGAGLRCRVGPPIESKEARVNYFSAIVLSGLLLFGSAAIYATSGQLPVRVASHFDAAGFANGFMPRADYLLFMLVLTLGVPLLVVFASVVVPRIAPAMLKLPTRDYWLAPERRDQTYATLATSGFVMASIIACFLIALHFLVLSANSQTPPRLDNALMWALIALLIVSLLTWQWLSWRRFHKPQ